ncbi:hypothetical protein F5Y08DRAFT_314052 [Xylaria arbuscula]|nr:hypothetical protein F5Y08DRAFT_314052 [Xylaria arbuscula]
MWDRKESKSTHVERITDVVLLPTLAQGGKDANNSRMGELRNTYKSDSVKSPWILALRVTSTSRFRSRCSFSDSFLSSFFGCICCCCCCICICWYCCCCCNCHCCCCCRCCCCFRIAICLSGAFSLSESIHDGRLRRRRDRRDPFSDSARASFRGFVSFLAGVGCFSGSGLFSSLCLLSSASLPVCPLRSSSWLSCSCSEALLSSECSSRSCCSLLGCRASSSEPEDMLLMICSDPRSPKFLM